MAIISDPKSELQCLSQYSHIKYALTSPPSCHQLAHRSLPSPTRAFINRFECSVMSFTPLFSWPRAICLFFASTQARVALFDLLEYRAQPAAKRDDNVPEKRQRVCTADLVYSVLQAEPSNSEFCYKFVTSYYNTQTSIVTTIPVTYGACFATRGLGPWLILHQNRIHRKSDHLSDSIHY